jgi:hypothetical protein
MKEFDYCYHCSKKIRLSEDVGLEVYLGNHELFCRLVLIVHEKTRPSESKSSKHGIVLYGWFHRPSFKEKILRWELESKMHEAEDKALQKEVERLQRR